MDVMCACVDCLLIVTHVEQSKMFSQFHRLYKVGKMRQILNKQTRHIYNKPQHTVRLIRSPKEITQTVAFKPLGENIEPRFPYLF